MSVYKHRKSVKHSMMIGQKIKQRISVNKKSNLINKQAREIDLFTSPELFLLIKY